MNGIFLNVDIESIDDAKKIMELRYDELVEMFNTFRTKLEETKDVYDTSSAKLYREIGNLYLNMGIKYLNNDLKPVFRPYLTTCSFWTG